MTGGQDYAAWCSDLGDRLYERTGLDLVYFDSQPLASWWEEGLSVAAALERLIAAQAQPQSPSPSSDGPGPEELYDSFDMQQESILWPWLDDPSCDM